MKKILIVDDSVEIRDLVEATLSADDYRIFKAENGEIAVDIAKKENPDLIIMDVSMPGKLDGLQATKILKNNPETRACPIILLSAMAQDDDIEEGFAVGANDYFTKPFSPLELIKKVEEILK
jgi:CheY-like chemotaxis protein